MMTMIEQPLVELPAAAEAVGALADRVATEAAAGEPTVGKPNASEPGQSVPRAFLAHEADPWSSAFVLVRLAHAWDESGPLRLTSGLHDPQESVLGTTAGDAG